MPGTLVAVRARAPRYEPDWRTINNFEDPRVFYVSRTRGWVLGNDEFGSARLDVLALSGAQFYAHVNQMPPDDELQAWLGRHAALIAAVPEGQVYRLTAPAPGQSGPGRP